MTNDGPWRGEPCGLIAGVSGDAEANGAFFAAGDGAFSGLEIENSSAVLNGILMSVKLEADGFDWRKFMIVC